MVVLALVAGIVAAVFMSLLGREAAGWVPHLGRAVIRFAAKRIPEDERDRWRDEQLAELAGLADRPLSSLIFAADVLLNARATAAEVRAWLDVGDGASPQRSRWARLKVPGVGQLALCIGAYVLFSIVTGSLALSTDPSTAAANTGTVIAVEQSLHVFVEPSIQQSVGHSGAVFGMLAWSVINLPTAVAMGGLVYACLFRNSSFMFVRTMFLAVVTIAAGAQLILATTGPTAMPEWGMNSVMSYIGSTAPPARTLPDVDIAMAFIVAWPLARLVRERALKLAWAAYPFFLTWAKLAVGGTWVMGVAFAVLVAAAAAAIAARLTPGPRPSQATPS